MAPKRRLRVVGVILHCLIALAMILSSIAKLLGKIQPPGEFDHFSKYLTAIAIGEMVTAFAIVIPRTMSVGLLLASSFWGGAICVHLMAPQGQLDVLVPAGFLAGTWIGGYLRDTRMLFSFQKSR